MPNIRQPQWWRMNGREARKPLRLIMSDVADRPSKADIASRESDVRFCPRSEHSNVSVSTSASGQKRTFVLRPNGRSMMTN